MTKREHARGRDQRVCRKREERIARNLFLIFLSKKKKDTKSRCQASHAAGSCRGVPYAVRRPVSWWEIPLRFLASPCRVVSRRRRPAGSFFLRALPGMRYVSLPTYLPTYIWAPGTYVRADWSTTSPFHGKGNHIILLGRRARLG